MSTHSRCRVNAGGSDADEPLHTGIRREAARHLHRRLLTKLIDIGYQTGLFEAAVEGPATSGELAARAELDERYVREWLGAMATSGIFLYDAASGRYRLPQEHAVSLTGAAARNVSPMSGVIRSLRQALA